MTDRDIKHLEMRFGLRWRWLAVATVMLGTMATVLSATIVNVALPDIMDHFQVTQGQAHWLATGFLAAVTATMLASGWLVDHWGARRTLAAAMLLFCAASILGALAPNLPVLVGARVLQGVSAGFLQPLAMYMVFRIFPREERGKAMGIYGVGVILAPALGPVLGGFVVDQLDWRFVMLAPVPLTLLGLAMSLRFLPDADPELTPYRFDRLGLFLLTLFLLLALDALNRAQHGFDHMAVLGLEAILAIAAFVGFLSHQRRSPKPLLNFELLRQPHFRYASWGAMILGVSLYGTTYLIPLFVQTALDYSATEAGLLLLPAGIAMGVLFPIAGRMADHRAGRPLIMGGMMVFAVAGTLFALSGINAGFFALAGYAILGRVGLSFMMPALSTTALNPLPNVLLGQGSGTINFSRQLGGALGVNLIAILIELGPANDQGQPALAAYHAAWWLIVACALLALIPAWRLGPR